MESFFAELKRVRESQKISLAEISDVTLINLKMLEALERGDTGSLPEAYVRAFIRGYAGAIGLDKDATMAKYDAMRSPKMSVEPKPAPAAPSPVSTPVSAPEPGQATDKPRSRITPMLMKIGIAIIVLVLIDLFLWNILSKDPSPSVQEVPFRDVVREHERKAGLTDTSSVNKDVRATSIDTDARTKQETARATPAASPPPVALDKDSLTLVATTTDSVWMQIVVDDENLTEHYLLPHATVRWRAKNEFWISAIGNPGAIKFALNNKPISIPVRPGFVTRDVRLNRESLQPH